MPTKKKGQSAEEEQTPKSTEEKQEDQDLSKFGDKFTGKSAAEIAEMYSNLEKTLGEKDKAVKERDEELTAYKNWYQQAVNQAQANQTQQRGQYGQNPYQSYPQESEKSTDYTFWDKPEEATKKVLQQELYNYDLQRRYQDALSGATFAEEMAKDKFPDVFDGLKAEEVRGVLMNGVNSGAISPDLLKSPEAWANAAGMIQLRKKNFKLGTAKPEPTETGTETPDQTKKQPYDDSDSVKFDARAHKFMKEFGVNEKEATEMVLEERKRREGDTI